MSQEIPDWFLSVLRKAAGDLPAFPGTSRWGKVKSLQNFTSPLVGQPNIDHLTFVATDWLPEITPLAVKFRFSLDGVTYSPTIPLASGAQLQINLTEAIDQKTGAFHEQFLLNPGDGFPLCTVIARHLTIDVQLIGEDQQLWVLAVAAPTTMVDCPDITGTPAPVTLADYATTNVTRFTLSTFVYPGSVVILPANAARRQFFVQNYGDTDVGLLLRNGTINWTPGAELQSIILPGGFSAIYESPVGCYSGVVKASVKPGGPTPNGFLAVTEGTP